ncbi:seryl-tRNA synthetase [Metamycoplasma arthritidis]|uniref:Serine--tRNA ligase n=1 Tax=Metamycoplasma arthritidis (strain 158L3-1) TaxID=243272 RepID=SYS_META1|nr:serine--tRNA ligase [Metamycoplasma arthritidis]B3PNG9.1 RecName: Full=Serine--tRNA ligase; AltName: Full=Seryl-tRNA synthetase; Short=SerRS; AltName: Full=Seryl-tRNA(Ser/Sec) synthetase [Metamycoplasma arthritidis 158L3-1]ACF07571.1 seryl-tRNA synthetase [Metamycoplasma arthritidis 158L3-1]VEU79079.1 seryl-tRNA synthetase [Metamycoplasma arthritidis]
MLDLKFILNNKNEVIKKLSTRNYDLANITKINNLGEMRSKLIFELEKLQAKRNKLSDEIGIKKRNNENCDSLIEEVNAIKAQIEKVDHEADDIISQVNDILTKIPNLPYDDVPVGSDELDNKVIKEHASLGRGLVKGVEAHYDIATKLDIIDFTRAVKLAQTRFVLYKNAGAKLIRALANFMLDTHINNGYKEIMPAHLVNSKMLFGTGQLPKFKDDLFRVSDSDLWLIPTAEVPLTNYHYDEILNLNEPIKYVAYTKCFRSEAGSGGRDTRGIIRQHEFHKVELVKIVRQEDAMGEWEKMVNDAKNILTLLELPYREILLCTGDMGFSSAKTIDLEIWIPSEQRYRETSSISICKDFQARRAKIRYKDADGKTKYAFTMNGSGVAIDRVMAAILENYQNSDGTITVPKVLVPYMNGITKIEAK